MGTIPSARRLFGTDGVRGVVGEFLTADLALGLGRAATAWSRAEVPQVLIIRDTRESGEMLEAAVAAGVAAAGGHALMGGVLPTPGASLLALRYELDLACVVSASHNPYQDNGIKFFGPDGMKLPDAVEDRIEAALAEPLPSGGEGTIRSLERGRERYLAHLEDAAPARLDGMTIVVDCANGAASQLAPRLYERLGATV